MQWCLLLAALTILIYFDGLLLLPQPSHKNQLKIAAACLQQDIAMDATYRFVATSGVAPWL